MANQTSEKEVEKEIATCGGGGTEYDLRKRLEEMKDIPKPNTAGEYCNDHCWTKEDAAQEYA